MRTERRCFERSRPWGISYFEFAAGGGGIVLDASERGMAFQAADAVPQLGSRRIFISPHPDERIELNADVVWTDTSKKTGGLRFIDPSADSCHRIDNWLKQAAVPGASDQREEYRLPGRAVEEVPDLPRDSWNPYERPVPSPPRVQDCEPRAVEPRLLPILPPLGNSNLTSPSQEASGVPRGFLHQVATGFLIGASVLACGALAENFGLVERFRPKVARTLIRLGEELNGTTDSPSRVPTPLPHLPQAPSEPSPAVKAIPEAAQPAALSRSDPVNSSARSNSETPSVAIPRAKEGTYHSAYSRTPGMERSVEANRLWSAVEAGSSEAETDLALLYLKGEGVPRNCEQARILLRAAARSGSRLARQQLQKLRPYGCR